MNKTKPIECICGGYHYIQVDKWDESGAKIVAFVGEPQNLWQWFKWYWKHRKVWVADIVLEPKDLEELKEILK